MESFTSCGEDQVGKKQKTCKKPAKVPPKMPEETHEYNKHGSGYGYGYGGGLFYIQGFVLQSMTAILPRLGSVH
jgi:hypothetical protein